MQVSDEHQNKYKYLTPSVELVDGLSQDRARRRTPPHARGRSGRPALRPQHRDLRLVFAQT